MKGFVEDPPSMDIAKALTLVSAECCVHGRSPCTILCGVRRIDMTEREIDEESGAIVTFVRYARWVPIAKEERRRVEAEIDDLMRLRLSSVIRSASPPPKEE